MALLKLIHSTSVALGIAETQSEMVSVILWEPRSQKSFFSFPYSPITSKRFRVTLYLNFTLIVNMCVHDLLLYLYLLWVYKVNMEGSSITYAMFFNL